MYFWIFVIVSAVWVLFDAKNIGVKKGLVAGVGDMGPWAWAIVTAFLWIVGFPMYLHYRGKFKLAVAAANNAEIPESKSFRAVAAGGGSLDDLEKLGVLRQKNLITDVEFEAKKKQILGL